MSDTPNKNSRPCWTCPCNTQEKQQQCCSSVSSLPSKIFRVGPSISLTCTGKSKCMAQFFFRACWGLYPLSDPDSAASGPASAALRATKLKEIPASELWSTPKKTSPISTSGSTMGAPSAGACGQCRTVRTMRGRAHRAKTVGTMPSCGHQAQYRGRTPMQRHWSTDGADGQCRPH